MIGRVWLGSRDLAALLDDIYHPVEAATQSSARLVTGWQNPASIEPPARPDGRRDFQRLTDWLMQPVNALGDWAPENPVWHCTVHAAPGDPELGDAAWTQIAGEIMHRTGLSRHGEEAEGVRWVAVRHGENHIHIAATLARQDGRPATLRNEYYQVGVAVRDMETRYGLQTMTRPAAVYSTTQRTPRGDGKNRRTDAASPKVSEAVAKAAEIKAKAAKYGLTVTADLSRDFNPATGEHDGKVIDATVTVEGTFTPGDARAYAVAETAANTVLGMVRMVRPGSVWGTDSASVGGHAGMTGGYVRMNKSGAEISVARHLAAATPLTGGGNPVTPKTASAIARKPVRRPAGQQVQPRTRGRGR